MLEDLPSHKCESSPLRRLHKAEVNLTLGESGAGGDCSLDCYDQLSREVITIFPTLFSIYMEVK